METAIMEQVRASAKIDYLVDLDEARRGIRSPEQVRSVTVDAIVDTGAKLLCLPRSIIQQLGLECFATKMAQTCAGRVPCKPYRAVWLTIEDRQCTVDVAEVPDDCPPLIGNIPLELLDFVVDPTAQRLIGNPRHGGQNIIDML